MAGPMAPPSTGFSYAQAARGRQQAAAAAAAASQSAAASTESPSATSGTSGSPAAFTDLGTTKDWAEDVEATVRAKTQAKAEETQDTAKPSEVKSSVVERTKLESKIPSHSSGVSSPDMAASATSHDDLSSSAQNESSLSSWEAKSPGSETVVPTEPAWIAERKERQNKPEPAAKTGNTAIMPEQKPVVLHDAPLPAVNPWAKRAEVAKTKAVAPAPSSAKSKDVSPNTVRSAQLKENSKPKSDSQPKPHTVAAKSETVSVTKTSSENTANRSIDTTNTPRPRRTESKTSTTQPPSVNDEVSWPTPETSQEAERKSAATHSPSEEKYEDEVTSGKPRKKQEWKPVAVVPNIIWETPGVRERGARPATNGERPSRGGANTRGRGGSRGASNAAINGDRTVAPADVTSATGAAESATPATFTPQPAEQREPKVQRKTNLTNGSKTADSSIIEIDSQISPEIASLPAKPTIDDKEQSLPLSDHKRDLPFAQLSNGIDSSVQRAEFIPASDSRKDGQTKEPWAGGRGNARRGGRGRGGNRDFGSGHANPYSNGQTVDFPAAFTNGTQFVPRGGHQASHNYGRAGSRASGTRTQSLPFDFYRFQNQYLPQVPMSPMQAFQPPISEFTGYAMPASPVPGQMEQAYVIGTVIHQLDYYFSLDNLVKDTYLRKNMDSQGFVLLEVIAGFNRLKQLTTDYELLKFACIQSEVVEVVTSSDDGKDRVRNALEWKRWTLSMDERFAAARNAGPQHFESIGRNFYAAQMQPRHQGSTPFITAPRPGDRRSYDASVYGFTPQMSPHAMFAPEHMPASQSNEHATGDDTRGRVPNAPALENGIEHSTQAAPVKTYEDPDVFSDQNIEQLTVCVMLKSDDAPQFASSRTFSNGSIDAQVLGKISKKDGEKDGKKDGKKDGEKDCEKDSKKDGGKDGEKDSKKDGEKDGAKDSTKDSKLTNGDAAIESDASVTSPSGQSAQDFSVFWIKDKETPVGSLPINLTPEPYYHLRMKALEQRDRAATGNCPYDLDVLYQFWSHFLIRNFNNTMYSEFVHFAHEDAAERYSTVGHRSLVKYYHQALHSINLIPLRVAKDLLALAKADQKDNDGAFKNLHRALRNGALNIRNRKRVTDIMDTELRQLLEG